MKGKWSVRNISINVLLKWSFFGRDPEIYEVDNRVHFKGLFLKLETKSTNNGVQEMFLKLETKSKNNGVQKKVPEARN